ncbi:hypothetical protein BDV93DRAFT_516443 [Ceratobasidium sp. AG-I]|nr:hypothetical protein BDV93DRAFT_516443 [Ceratobasidium sp. AG-I]
MCLYQLRLFTLGRGLNGQIKRKEMWQGDGWFDGNQVKWIVAFQTSHIIDYHSDSLRRQGSLRSLRSLSMQSGYKANRPELVKSMVQLNCTKRRRGLPCDGAIPTGGQLIRVSKFEWPGYSTLTSACYVWSSQSFAEGEYDEICNTPLAGPQHTSQKHALETWRKVPRI